MTVTSRSYLAVLGAAVACYAALGAVLRVLPEHVLRDLHSGSVALGLAVGAPAITAIATRPLGGRLADRHGPRPVLLGGALLMAIGALPAIGHGGLPPLVVSRLVVGAGEGLMMSSAVLWLLRLTGEERRGRALGHIGLANYAGLTLGPLLAQALQVEASLAAAAVLPLLGGALVTRLAAPRADRESEPAPAAALLRATLRPGIGLMLVNFGYAALISFGSDAAAGNGVASASLTVPAFAVTVIVVRTAGGSIPDRLGGGRTLAIAAPLAAIGLATVGVAAGIAVLLTAIVVLAAGQALAVPALGLLAIRRVNPSDHGAAAGLFFAWFDAGVAAGGPLAGAVASIGSASGALAAAAVAVALSAPVAAAA